MPDESFHKEWRYTTFAKRTMLAAGALEIQASDGVLRSALEEAVSAQWYELTLWSQVAIISLIQDVRDTTTDITECAEASAALSWLLNL